MKQVNNFSSAVILLQEINASALKYEFDELRQEADLVIADIYLETNQVSHAMILVSQEYDASLYV